MSLDLSAGFTALSHCASSKGWNVLLEPKRGDVELGGERHVLHSSATWCDQPKSDRDPSRFGVDRRQSILDSTSQFLRCAGIRRAYVKSPGCNKKPIERNHEKWVTIYHH